MSWLDLFRPARDPSAEPQAPPRIVPMDVVTESSSVRKGAISASIAIAGTLAAIYADEGGYVNNPNDRGGATNWGITQKTARAWGYQGDMRDFPKRCGPNAPICADQIYRVDYIKRPGFEPLASVSYPVLQEVANSAVLHGPVRSARWYYLALNDVCRTNFVPAYPVRAEAIAAYQQCEGNHGRANTCRQVLNSLDGQQYAFMESIVRKDASQKVFWKGWISRRIGNVNRKECEK